MGKSKADGIPVGVFSGDSLDEDDRSVLSVSKAANVDYYAGADEADPTLKLLRLNPYRWFVDKVESTYSLPHTEHEMEAINQYEERQQATRLAKKERERLKWEEQEAILNQKREALKRRTTYLWSKLRIHAFAIGHMVKSGQMEVQHVSDTEDHAEKERIRRALMSHSDSHSTLSTVPEETKLARDVLMRELEEQKALMQDITTFETDQNKIIVIQKKQPKRRGVTNTEGPGQLPGQGLGQTAAEVNTAAAVTTPQATNAYSSSSSSSDSSSAAESATLSSPSSATSSS